MENVFDSLAYDQAELQQVMRDHYDRIIAFITTKPFQAVMIEMSATPAHERPKFVADVLVNSKEMANRGVQVPKGILIQRSAFGDRRPTLFAVKHFLPPKYADVWQNVNITFDNEYVDASVKRDRATCWRAPLSPAEQAEAVANDPAMALA